MASSQQHCLPPDVQENIVHNIQKIFPNYVDKKVIRAVLNRECWDLEKSLAFLKSSLQSFSDNPNVTKKKENKLKKTNQAKTLPQKNKPINKNTTSVPNKPPELLKNFKKKTKTTKKVKEQNCVKPRNDVVQGGWVLIDENSSRTTKDTKRDSSTENKSQINDSKSAKKKRMIQHYEIIKQFGEPLNRIAAYINGGIKVMILLRGCSGSGKTTYATQLLKKYGAKYLQCHIFSADNFFLNKEGRYNFNFDLLSNAHDWNQKLVRLAVSEGRSPIFVDNTNTRLWEMKEYACMAVEFGYVVETLEPPTPWFFNEDMLVRKTLHNVPRDTIKKMLERYEANISGEDVLRALQVNYGSLTPPQFVIAGLDIPMSKKHAKLNGERLTQELPNKPLNKSVAKKSSTKPPDVSRFKPPRLMERSEGPARFPILANKPAENMRFQPMQENSSMRFGGIYAGNSNFGPNNFIGPRNHTMPTQPLHFPQNFYNQNNGPLITAAVPNVFNSHFNNRGFVQPNFNNSNGPSNFYPPVNRPPSGPQIEISKDFQPATGNMGSASSYVDDLIDLTVPENTEIDFKGNGDEISSSVSLLEGLKIENETLDQLESDSDEEEDEEEDEDESSIEETSYSESDGGVESSTSYASAFTNVPQVSFEYVLLTPEKEIIFQKSHDELGCIKTLEEFKKTSSLSLSSFPKNFEDFLLQYMENSRSVKEEGVEEDKMSSNFISDFIDNANKNEEDTLVQGSSGETEKTERIRPTTSLGDWDHKENSIVMSTSLPKDQREKLPVEIRKISNLSVQTNTNYMDFEILREVNNGGVIEEAKILNGSPCFVSELCKIPHPPVSVLMLDKGVMTSDIETSQVLVRDCGIDRLALMFPTVSRDNLEELFDKCQKDIDWTVGLLLDSGQEMSELYSSLEPIECSTYNDNILLPCDSSDMKDAEILQGEIKKQKKKKNDSDLDKYKEIQEKIQRNFVLGENHYSEKMKKHIERKHNILIGTPSEVAPAVKPEDEYILEKETKNSDTPVEGSDSDEDVVFMMDSDFIFQLQSRFGGLLRPNMIGEKTVVSMPSSLARQLHSFIMDSVLQQIEGEDIFAADSIMNKDEEMARQLQDEEMKARGIPSLLEIMDEEVALRKSIVQKDSSNGRSMASTLSKQLLIERFPLMDPGTLASILEDTNHSLHEATCLLSSAGHFLAEPKETVEQSDTVETQEKSLSREEAIKQADAYGDIASKLYELRKDCLKKSQNAYREGNPSVALYYSDMARWYMERIEKSNSLAAKAILSGYEGWSTLDLHFLQVSEALNVLDLFVDEVIRGLQGSKDKKAVVYIITGRGLHSAGGRPRLKPAVQSRLYKRDLRFAEQNPGMLRVVIPRTALTSYNREVAVNS